MINKNINLITRKSQQLFLELADRVSRQSPKLSFALDFLRPHVRALGLRVAQLSAGHIEIILPDKIHNRNERGHVLEGAIVMAAGEVMSWIWMQNKPEGNLEVNIQNISYEGLRPLLGELRLRAELSEIVRETCLLQLAQRQGCHCSLTVMVYDNHEQVVAKVEVEAKLNLTPALNWT